MRRIATQYPGKCRQCRKPHNVGDTVYWQKGIKGVLCVSCGEEKSRPPAPNDPRSLDMDMKMPIPTLPPEQKGKPDKGKSEIQVKGDSSPIPVIHSDEKNENDADVITGMIEWADLKTQARRQFFDGIAPSFNPWNKDRWYQEAIKTSNDKWRGYKAEDVKRWLDRGFQLQGLQFDNPPIPIREKRRYRLDENGEEFLADMLYSGEDIFTADYTKREVIPGLAIEASVAFSSNVNEKILKDYFSFLCRAIYALEMSGIDLQVVLTDPLMAVAYDHPKLSGLVKTSVRVKKEGEASDFNSWSPMLSPASLRTFMFLATFNHADSLGGNVRHGIGTPVATQWGVKFNADRRVIEIIPGSREGTAGAKFPAEKMESELRSAIAASR